jgi:hypothetical protein
MGLESPQHDAHDSGPQESRKITTSGRLDMRTSIQFSRTVNPDSFAAAAPITSWRAPHDD